MFTGIIEEIGQINSFHQKGGGEARISVKCHKIMEDLKIGDSIAVNGLCLTVTQFDPSEIHFDLSLETISNSRFSSSSKGIQVNLERAMNLKDRFGGHIVQGHIDGLGRVTEIQQRSDFYELFFQVDANIHRYLIHKGSVTVDGISLTLATLRDDGFSVSVIPLTFKGTNLKFLKQGDQVHIETDVIGRYVEKLLQPNLRGVKSKITPEFLRDNGF